MWKANQNILIRKSSHNFFYYQKPGVPPLNQVIFMVNVSKEGEIYECEICGNIVVVKVVGGGELICCGQPMNLKKE